MTPAPPFIGMARAYWQLQHGDPYGGSSCTAYAAAAVIAWDSAGIQRPSGADVRRATDEPIPRPGNPGLTLDQVSAAASRWGVRLDVHRRMPWGELADALRAGHAAVLQLSYEPLRASSFAGSRTFGGGHAIAVFPGWWVIDPLADGRAAGIYRGPGVYPESLLRTAAGQLVLRVDAKGRVTDRVGLGAAYAALGSRTHLPAAPVIYAFDGVPKSRGTYTTTVAANLRTAPAVRPGTLVRVLPAGEAVYIAQRTDTGQSVAGSRRWYGDATGARWLHSSVVRPT